MEGKDRQEQKWLPSTNFFEAHQLEYFLKGQKYDMQAVEAITNKFEKILPLHNRRRFLWFQLDCRSLSRYSGFLDLFGCLL